MPLNNAPILVVCDDAETATALVDAISEARGDVVYAVNSNEALHRLRQFDVAAAVLAWRSLIIPVSSDVERALRQLIDDSDAIAVLFDNKYRLLHSSPKHRALLRLDASELYGRSYEQFQADSQAAMHASFGGQRGWWGNGISKITYTFLRKRLERARNPRAFAQRGVAWSIRDCVGTPMVLGITHKIPITDYVPNDFVVTTLDDRID